MHAHSSPTTSEELKSPYTRVLSDLGGRDARFTCDGKSGGSRDADDRDPRLVKVSRTGMFNLSALSSQNLLPKPFICALELP